MIVYQHEAGRKVPWGYIRPFSPIELACAVGQSGPCVRAFCESGVLFHMSNLKLHFALHNSHCTLRAPNFISQCTLKTPHFTLHTSDFTVHTSHFSLFFPLHTLHSTPHFTLHSVHCTLHAPGFTLHFSHFTHLHTPHCISSEFFSPLVYSRLTSSLLICHRSFHESLPSSTSRTYMRRAPATSVRACFVRSCCADVVQEHDLTLQTAFSHFTLALHTCTSHSTNHLISIISLLFISSHPFSHVIQISSSQLFSFHPSTDRPFSSPRSSQLIPPVLHARKVLLSERSFLHKKNIGRRKFLHADIWDTGALTYISYIPFRNILYYNGWTKHFPVPLCTTKFAQSTFQDYFALRLRPVSARSVRTECTKCTQYTCSAPSAPSALAANQVHRVHRVHRVHFQVFKPLLSIYLSIYLSRDVMRCAGSFTLGHSRRDALTRQAGTAVAGF